jgi:hypothetical protein
MSRLKGSSSKSLTKGVQIRKHYMQLPMPIRLPGPRQIGSTREIAQDRTEIGMGPPQEFPVRSYA